jgi:hypothetical protein
MSLIIDNESHGLNIKRDIHMEMIQKRIFVEIYITNFMACLTVLHCISS